MSSSAPTRAAWLTRTHAFQHALVPDEKAEENYPPDPRHEPVGAYQPPKPQTSTGDSYGLRTAARVCSDERAGIGQATGHRSGHHGQNRSRNAISFLPRLPALRA